MPTDLSMPAPGSTKPTRGLTQVAWYAWVACVAVLTPRLLLWHVEYYKTRGPEFYRIAPFFLAALAAGAVLYALLRRKLLWRFELLAMGIFALVVLLCYQPRATLVCALLFFAASSAGGFIARMAKLAPPGPLDRVLVRFGLGAGAMIPAFFVIGEMRLFYPGVFLGILAALIVLPYRDTIAAVSDLRALDGSWSGAAELRHPLIGAGMIFAFLALALTLIAALTPSTSFDALDVHLPSVAHYASSHSIGVIKQIDYSYFPQGSEILWTIGYSLAGQAGVRAISVLFFAMFLISVFCLARECFADDAVAVTATLWTATFPFLHWSGSVIKNDMPMSFFQELALYAFLRWLAVKRFEWIIAGAFFLAQSFGIKHVALFGGIPLALFTGYAIWKQPRRWRAAAVVALVVVLTCSFWTIRTYVLTGNPAYPQTPRNTYDGAVAEHGASLLEKVARFATLPWTIVFHGEPTFESFLPSPAGIVLFAFFPLALCAMRQWRRPAVMACVVFALIYFIYWAAILSIVRYAMVLFAVAAIFCAQGAFRFYAGGGSWIGMLKRFSVVATEIYCLIVALLGMMVIEINRPQLALLAHRIDERTYLESILDHYRSLEYLQKVAAPGSATFSIENCSREYAPNPLQFHCVRCSTGACDPANLAREIDEYRPRYIILPTRGPLSASVGALTPGAAPAPARIYRDEYFTIYQVP